MIEAFEKWDLARRHIGREVRYFPRLDSTNQYASGLDLGDGENGLVILTNEQTAGRGQYGRRWLAGPGSSVLMSVALMPPPLLRRPVILTAWAAVAAAETIRLATGLQARIKWPNDLLIDGRKVCGILIEQGRGTVVGIGMNANQSEEEFAAAGLPLAGSLASLSGRDFDARELALELIEQLDAEYDPLLRGEHSALESCWAWRLGLLGHEAIVEDNAGQRHRGRVLSISFSDVCLESTQDGPIRFLPEQVRSFHRAGSAPMSG